MNALERLRVRSSVEGCENCGLHKVAQRPIPFRGPSPASIAVIGEAPSALEDAIGKPFVGPSGNLADRWLRDAGINPDECAWLNVVSCFPNRTPTGKEVESCAPNLDAQLRVIQPQWIIMFGGVAVGRWWPGIRMGDIRGKFWQIDIQGLQGWDGHSREGNADDGFVQTLPTLRTVEVRKAWVMATWHPTAVLRNDRLSVEVADDLRRFRRVVALEGRDPLARDRGQVNFPFNYDCFVCGALGDRWLNQDGTENVDDGRGALAMCSKHWETRMGKSGGGVKKPGTSSGESSKKPRPPRKVKPTQETMI